MTIGSHKLFYRLKQKQQILSLKSGIVIPSLTYYVIHLYSLKGQKSSTPVGQDFAKYQKNRKKTPLGPRLHFPYCV